VLIDTGYGLRDVDHPHRGPSPASRRRCDRSSTSSCAR
jgi:hypothetical protein